jgi:hypothetical protein
LFVCLFVFFSAVRTFENLRKAILGLTLSSPPQMPSYLTPIIQALSQQLSPQIDDFILRLSSGKVRSDHKKKEQEIY